MEGGIEIKESIIRILNAGIPVMGHLGLTPQSIYKFGTYTVRAKEKKEAERLINDAKVLDELGCFGIVLEKIPASVSKKVTKAVKVPVIGIGAGSDVDGQVLVTHDLVGLSTEFNPRFLRRYIDMNNLMSDAIKKYIKDVKNLNFPNKNEQY
jgi:3-methyl-2-oxobutanoate hydroxymethyltransferase